MHLSVKKKGAIELQSYFAKGAELIGTIAVDSASAKQDSRNSSPDYEIAKKRKRSDPNDDVILKAVEMMTSQARQEAETFNAEMARMASVLTNPTSLRDSSSTIVKPTVTELHSILSSLEDEIEKLESSSTFQFERPTFAYIKKQERWNKINEELQRLLNN